MEDRMTAQKLKNSILQMAVQGKLVPQDPNDEPASVLLERIRKEKEQLIKDGKIKRNKNESYIFRGADNLHYEQIGKEVRCIEDELPFEIPDSWEWTTLGMVLEIARGGSPRPIKDYLTESANGINWIKIGDTEKGGKYINQVKEKIKPEGASKSRLVHKGDFLLTNSMSFGRPYILNVDGCIHDGWLVLSDGFKVFDKDYLYYLLSSKFAYYQFCESVSGAVVKNLNSDKVAISRFAIPPINEQKRIVNKIKSLEPLIEKYEVIENELYELDSSIKSQLKKSILQYAIEGKLVPQDPNDEPASVLLERIRKEKEKLTAEGKIKKDKNESVIYRRDNSYYEKCGKKSLCIDEKIPFDIPKTWEWTNIESISLLIGNRNNQIPTNQILPIGSIPVVSQSKELIDGYCNNEDKKIDILPLVMFGDHTRNVKYIDFEFVVGADGTKFHKIILCNAKYIYYWMKHYARIIINRGYARHYSLLKECYIPLPPIQEQNRIVSKIETILLEINTL